MSSAAFADYLAGAGRGGADPAVGEPAERADRAASPFEPDEVLAKLRAAGLAPVAEDALAL